MPVPLSADAHEHGLAGDGTTNDQPAFQRLVDDLGEACAADGRRRTIHVPAGRYVIQDRPVLWRSGVSLIGAGRGVTCYVLRNPGAPTRPVPLTWFTAAQHGAGKDNHLADITFAHFEVDGSGVRTREYDPLAKGLGAVRAPGPLHRPSHPRHRRDRLRLRLPAGHGRRGRAGRAVRGAGLR